MDINIKTEREKFKFRVAGILELNNKILVTKMRNNNFYCFPGGHVELLEDTEKAVKRELKEELFFDFELEKLMYIHENFFTLENGTNFHELCFYYKGTPINKNLKQEDLLWEEIDKGEKLYHNYKWIDLNEIDKYDIRPKPIIENYVKNKNEFKHFISNELKTK